MKNALSILIALFLLLKADAQSAPGGWTTDPFRQHAFIENKGQFDGKDKRRNSEIMYGVSNDGVDIYFTKEGITWRHDRSEREEKKMLPIIGGKIEEEEEKIELIAHMAHMNWEGADANVKIIASDPITSYYTYPDLSDRSGNKTLKAFAYKKIRYQNLYPGIDVEFVVHEKSGVKYSLHLQPGANASLVKMIYKGIEGISKDAEGNIRVSTRFGELVDHAPSSFYQGGKGIISSFELKGSSVSFKMGTYDHSKSVVIDPWLANPNYTGFNSAYDVNFDVAGNVYACGSYNPFKLVKVNNAGAVQWTFNAAQINATYYGDFATDEGTGTCYIVEGLNNGQGSNILKVNNQGIQTAKFNGNTQITEMWRCEYNRCIKKIVIAGGGVSFTFQAAMMDTSMSTLTPVNVLSTNKTFRDMALLGIDNNSNFCYMSTTKSVSAPTIADDNILIKCPIPALIPLGFAIRTFHRIGEMGSVCYVNNMVPNGNAPAVGFNGLTVSPTGVYTYDSDSVKRWNKNTGALLAAIDASATAPIYAGYTGSEIQVKWGGIWADECDNLYVGVDKAIKCYNSNLTLTNTIALSNTVFDVKLGVNNKLYACGVGFVQEIAVTPLNKTITMSATPSTGCSGCSGTATANITCGNGNLSGYGYSWSPGGQSTQTATALCAGIYTVTVTSYCVNSMSATVQVTGGSGSGLVVAGSTIGGGCGSLGSASATSSSGTGPYTYSWNPTGQNTQTATGLTNGTYTVTITDANGCSGTTSINVTNNGSLTANTTFSNVLCNGGVNGTASVTASGGSGTMTYSWSNGQTNQTATGLGSGTYTVTVTDNSGCSTSKTISVTQPAALALNQGQVNAGCNTTGSASVTASGGTGAFTYSWNNGQTSQTATGLAAGSYTVTVTDNNGCSTTAAYTITGGVGPTISGVNPTNVLCNGGTNGSATATGTGGTGTLTYSWSNGQATSNATGLTAGTYTVTVTDNNGCSTTTTVIVTEPPVLTVNANGTVSCAGQAATASATGAGGTGAYNYLWNNGQASQTATGLTNGTYTVVITDANNCTATATAVVNANASPSAVFTGVDTVGCVPLCVTFNNASANIATWSWTFGDGSTGTGASPKHCYTSPGTYSVSLTVIDNNGCTGTYTKPNWIQVYPTVTAAFSASPQPTTVLNPVIQFTDQSQNATSWKWSFGDLLNSTSILQNPSFNYKDSGCYNVVLIADNQYNCPDTAQEQVCIQGDYELYAPNAFTPDGSGLNDLWNVKGIGIDPAHFKLWIFDRWGNLIYETSDLYKGWDGRANGGKDIAQQDVYVWKVATQDFIGNKHNYIGHINLVR